MTKYAIAETIIDADTLQSSLRGRSYLVTKHGLSVRYSGDYNIATYGTKREAEKALDILNRERHNILVSRLVVEYKGEKSNLYGLDDYDKAHTYHQVSI